MKVASILFFLCLSIFADDPADAAYKRGLDLLRESQTDHAALVPATKALAEAAELYTVAHDDKKAAEANSCLYWARKKLTAADLDGVKSVSKQIEIATRPSPATEAKQWLERADNYASSESDPLLVAIRYFEVGDRFHETAAGRSAIEKSLAAMQKAAQSVIKQKPPAQIDLVPNPPHWVEAPKPVLNRTVSTNVKVIHTKDIIGKWIGVNPNWTRPSVVEFRADNVFVMLDKKIGGSWETTSDSILLHWQQYPTDEIARLDADNYSMTTDKGRFTLKRVGAIAKPDNTPLDISKIDYDRLTAAKWDSAKGVVFRVPARVKCDTNILVSLNGEYRIIPHPDDKWCALPISEGNSRNENCDFSGYCPTSGRVHEIAKLVWQVEKDGPAHPCSDKVDQPGRIVLHMNSDSDGAVGEIRVKVVRIK